MQAVLRRSRDVATYPVSEAVQSWAATTGHARSEGLFRQVDFLAEPMVVAEVEGAVVPDAAQCRRRGNRSVLPQQYDTAQGVA